MSPTRDTLAQLTPGERPAPLTPGEQSALLTPGEQPAPLTPGERTARGRVLLTRADLLVLVLLFLALHG